ncbi:MAG: hypothetical protein Q8N23_06245 [Archangium sp.]|nr:hypothetical protein [Archangium sp.]MDP3570648.1 hypothetical protein [Archangium sp.]
MRRWWAWAVFISACQAPIVRPPCELAPQLGPGLSRWGVQGQPLVVNLDGPTDSCAFAATATVELAGPQGKTASATTTLLSRSRQQDRFILLRTVAVEFTPSVPGRWMVTARWSTGDTVTQAVDIAALVVAREPPAIRRRFVHQMDVCVRGPFRTTSAVTLCQRADGEVWAYGSDGEVLEHFPGKQLAVRGDEVWSLIDQTLEHRTVTAQRLRVDGSVLLQGDGAEGPTRPGVAVRADADRTLLIEWDGTALTSKVITQGDALEGAFFVLENGASWNSSGCLVQQSRITCPPSAVFEQPNAIEDGFVWSRAAAQTDGVSMVLRLFARARPLSLEDDIIKSEIFMEQEDQRFQEGFSAAPGVERARLSFDGHLLLPRIETNEGQRHIAYDAIPLKNPALTVTDEWIISMEDPFTLLAAPMPSR